MRKSEESVEELDVQQIKRYMKVPVHKKLQFLHDMNIFLSKITPSKTKKIQRKFREMGF